MNLKLTKMTYDHIVSNLQAKRISQLFERAPKDANDPKKLSELTGISLEDIKLMDEGKLDPTLNMAYKLASAFSIPLENLYSDDQKITTQLEGRRKG